MGKRATTTFLLLALLATACGASGLTGGSGQTAPDPNEPVEGMTLSFGQLTERDVDINADGRNTTAAIEGLNAFAIDLYTEVAATESANVVLSPYSAAFALSMIYAGAGGETAGEMQKVLHADAENWHEGINAYDLALDARTSGSPTIWTAANKVWTQRDLELRPSYLDALTGSYGSAAAQANFGADVEAERAIINEWTAKQTLGLVPELFPAGSLDANTALVLVNAVAMDAPWEFPFNAGDTRPGSFTRPDGSVVDVPMMHYDEFLPSAWADTYEAVELPYGGGALSMVIIQPSDLATFERDLTVDSLDEVMNSIEDGGIHLSVPKWSSRTHVTLNDVLVNLGMPSAFGANADFSGMVEGGGLALDRVEHEAVIEVDEQGTRAAAATGGSMVGSHGPTVTINKSFFYVIRDRGAGTILFIGRVTDPSLEP